METALNEDGDELDGLMELETCFYDDGYRTGLEDGTQAGVIEGKLFGIWLLLARFDKAECVLPVPRWK